MILYIRRDEMNQTNFLKILLLSESMLFIAVINLNTDLSVANIIVTLVAAT